MNSNEFKCSICQGVFQYAWTNEEAVSEAEANNFNIDECDTVCDDCYQKSPWGDNCDK